MTMTGSHGIRSKAFQLWAVCFFLFLPLASTAVAMDDPRLSNEALWQDALSQIRQDQPESALSNLEQLVTRAPSDIDIRFELALTLFKLGKDERAKHHLDQLKATALSPGARNAVDELTTQIDQRNRITGYFSFGLLPESNVAKQTENGTIYIGGVPFQLNTIGEPGVSVKVNAGLEYSPRIKRNLQAKFGLDLSTKWNEEAIYRDTSLIGRAGLVVLPDPSREIELGLLVGRRWVADNHYSDTAGAYFGYQQRAGEKGQLSFYLQLVNTRHADQSPDNNIAFGHLSYTHGISANAQVTVGLFHQETQSKSATLAGSKTGASISGLYAFRGGIIAGLSLSHSVDQRDGFNPLLMRSARQDVNTKIDLSLHHRDFRIGPFAPKLLIGAERNKSNNALVDYSNTYMSIGFTRKF